MKSKVFEVAKYFNTYWAYRTDALIPTHDGLMVVGEPPPPPTHTHRRLNECRVVNQGLYMYPGPFFDRH